MPFNGFANVIYTWQDDVIFWSIRTPVLPGIVMAWPICGWRNDKDERYRLTFFVNNIFDETYASSKANLGNVFFPVR